MPSAVGGCDWGLRGRERLRAGPDHYGCRGSSVIDECRADEIGGPVTARFRHTPNGLKIQGRNSETLSVVLEQLGIAHMHSAWGLSETLANRQIGSTGFPGSWRGYRGRSMLP